MEEVENERNEEKEIVKNDVIWIKKNKVEISEKM